MSWIGFAPTNETSSSTRSSWVNFVSEFCSSLKGENEPRWNDGLTPEFTASTVYPGTRTPACNGPHYLPNCAPPERLCRLRIASSRPPRSPTVSSSPRGIGPISPTLLCPSSIRSALKIDHPNEHWTRMLLQQSGPKTSPERRANLYWPSDHRFRRIESANLSRVCSSTLQGRLSFFTVAGRKGTHRGPRTDLQMPAP